MVRRLRTLMEVKVSRWWANYRENVEIKLWQLVLLNNKETQARL